MDPDLDDTRLSAPRTVGAARDVDVDVDVDDTVLRPSTAPGGERTAPPELVEPPKPESRALPVVVDPGLPVVVAPSTVAEPYRAVLADGTEVPIDVPVYLGRKPSIPRIHGGVEPRLVALPSPTREMSATHLELTTVGGALVASDMRSTNGTVVQLPGAAPRTLIRGESAVIVAGTRIDLGEGAVIDILAPRGVAEPDADPS